MKKTILLIAFFICFSCQEAENATLAHAIASQNEKLHEVVLTKNIDLLDEIYAEDAYFLAPGDTVVKGIKNIKLKWQSSINYMSDMHSETLDVIGKGEIITEVGIVKTTIKTSDSTYIYKAKYTNVWKKDKKGTYKLTVDIWNTLSN
ncbi:putative Ketosteroid isomerase homolog [Flavobacterium sp. 9AF]|uniref:YybH family protein n=1 Tax=Flavobacterium sp. 9AF TaxID=2653142 RepID=UPI0012F35BE6|nr:nuclear transport factor 2 family protein [Flavobacterium sp. 9AF]VXB83983.1 putative Ketosteroid isomerase homolog [Flavobacterium sp. 9AF]